MIFGIVVFALVITASIALHELGHFLTARLFGMKATRFFIGFGPTLWSVRRGETEYGVKAFPVGGFVKIVGMTQLEEIEPGDEKRAFYRQPAEQRAVVLAAGSFMHFVIAFLVLAGALWFVGVPEGPGTTVDSVSACARADGVCRPGDNPSPAQLAGIRPGDKIISFEGEPVADWIDDFASRIRARPEGLPAEVVVERDGERQTLTVSVASVERTDPETGKVSRIGFVGLVPELSIRRYGPVSGLRQSGVLFAEVVRGTAKAIVELPGKLPQAFRQATGMEERTGEGAVSLVGAARVAGQASRAEQIADFLALIAGVNIFVGVFNLLPLLPLDGGHLAILYFEEFRSAIARRLRRPAPGRVNLNKLMPATVAFLAVLIGLQVLLLYADIANPIPDPFTRP